MSRFDKLDVGQKFVCQLGSTLYMFQKKSHSSAYVLDPESLAPTNDVHLTAMFEKCDDHGSIMGFGKSVEVHPLR
jgi:hypothetical protein